MIARLHDSACRLQRMSSTSSRNAGPTSAFEVNKVVAFQLEADGAAPVAVARAGSTAPPAMEVRFASERSRPSLLAIAKQYAQAIVSFREHPGRRLFFENGIFGLSFFRQVMRGLGDGVSGGGENGNGFVDVLCFHQDVVGVVR